MEIIFKVSGRDETRRFRVEKRGRLCGFQSLKRPARDSAAVLFVASRRCFRNDVQEHHRYTGIGNMSRNAGTHVAGTKNGNFPDESWPGPTRFVRASAFSYCLRFHDLGSHISLSHSPSGRRSFPVLRFATPSVKVFAKPAATCSAVKSPPGSNHRAREFTAPAIENAASFALQERMVPSFIPSSINDRRHLSTFRL